MRARKTGWFAVLITLAAALAGVPGFAQQTDTSTGVARVSLMKGDVSMMRGDSGTWVAATVNTPLVPGDTIATGAGSRAEVQLDYSNVLRLAENAQAKIADLNGSRIQLQVAHGTVDLAVLQGNQTQSEVDTPNVAVEPLQPGTYRIDVRSDELSLVTVRDGQAQASTPQGSTDVNAGKQITVEGSQNPQYQIADAPPLDAWDQWNQERNRQVESASNYQHVNRYYTGAQDLSAYGRWVQVPNYDWCWTPYVNAGWVPYSYGRWVWEPFYGWTWVSYNPWGWAPYHYGRWFFYNNIWCWWPGAVTPFYRPLWAPAYVSFVGFGYGYRRFSFGFGYGFGSIGWFPLGPRDRFHPWWGRGHHFRVEGFDRYYGHGRGGGRGFYGSNAERMMSNVHVRRSITVMSANRFGREAVLRTRRPVSTSMLRKANFVRGTLPVVPTRASLTAARHAPVVPRGAINRAGNTRFFSRRSPASPRGNHSFTSQTTSIRQMVRSRDHSAPNARPGNLNARGERTFRPSGTNQGNRTVRAFSNERGQNSGRSVRALGGRTTQSGNQNARANQQRFGAPNTQAGNARGAQQRSFKAGANAQNSRNEQTRAGWTRFGNRSSGTPAQAGAQQRRAAPVVRQGPQSRQSSAPRGAASGRQNQQGWTRFSGNAAASSPQNRGNVQTRNPQRAAPSGQVQQNRSGSVHRFTPQASPRNPNRSSGVSRATPQSRNQGWRQFTPRTQAPSQNRGGSYNRSSQPRQASPRYQSRPSSGSRSYSRPPLRLNKPIVTERRSRSYSAPRGNRSSQRGGFSRGSSPNVSRGSRGGGFRGSTPHVSRGSGGGGFRGSSRSSGGGHGRR